MLSKHAPSVPDGHKWVGLYLPRGPRGLHALRGPQALYLAPRLFLQASTVFFPDISASSFRPSMHPSRHSLSRSQYRWRSHAPQFFLNCP